MPPMKKADTAATMIDNQLMLEKAVAKSILLIFAALRKIPCLKTLKNEIQRFTDSYRPLTVIVSGAFCLILWLSTGFTEKAC